MSSICMFFLSMVSLNGIKTTIKVLPNQHTYNIEKPLVPTEYQSILEST
jgi:hypothetical protein